MRRPINIKTSIHEEVHAATKWGGESVTKIDSYLIIKIIVKLENPAALFVRSGLISLNPNFGVNRRNFFESAIKS